MGCGFGVPASLVGLTWKTSLRMSPLSYAIASLRKASSPGTAAWLASAWLDAGSNTPTSHPWDADRLTSSKLNLTGARIIGSTDGGTVRLLSAHIGSNLECDGAELRNDSGPALIADGLQVDQAMYLGGGFTATSGGGGVAVNLVGAHIGGLLDCTGAQLRNDSGSALAADGLQVGLALLLRGGFTATGHGDLGAVSLLGAHIGGPIDCTGAQLRNDSGPALIANGLQVDQAMYLGGGFTATAGGGGVAVDLTGARVGGTLWFDPAGIGRAYQPHRSLAVAGLTYPGVPEHVSARG
jgi:hypothetical protein